MKRRGFLKGLGAVLTAPLIVVKTEGKKKTLSRKILSKDLNKFMACTFMCEDGFYGEVTGVESNTR